MTMKDKTGEPLARIREIRAEAEGIKATAREQRANAAELIAMHRDAMERAQAAERAAEQAGDVDSYTAAREDYQREAAAVEMLERRGQLHDGPAIGSDYYKRQAAEIRAAWKDAETATRARLAELAEEMQAEGDRLATLQAEANAALRVLQHELYNDGDRARDSHGRAYLNDENTIRDAAAISWARLAVNAYTYRETRGENSRPAPSRPLWIHNGTTAPTAGRRTIETDPRKVAARLPEILPTGYAQAVTPAALCDYLDTDPATLRAAVAIAQKAGAPIEERATAPRGYYYSQAPELAADPSGDPSEDPAGLVF